MRTCNNGEAVVTQRVAEGELDQEEVALYFSQIHEGHTEVESLKLNLLGEIENWPAGFFGDPFAEVAAITRAAKLRAE